MFGTGSIIFDFAFEGGWPPTKPIIIEYDAIVALPNNKALVTLEITGRIIVEIFGLDGSSRKLQTPPILLESGAKLRAAFRWNEDDAALAVGGEVLARFPQVDGAAAETFMVKKRQARKPDVQQQLFEKSTKVHGARPAREAGVQPPQTSPGRAPKRLRCMAENIRALIERTLALAEMVEAARQGRNHHLTGVASMLRLLSCNAGGTHRPRRCQQIVLARGPAASSSLSASR